MRINFSILTARKQPPHLDLAEGAWSNVSPAPEAAFEKISFPGVKAVHEQTLIRDYTGSDLPGHIPPIRYVLRPGSA